MGLEARTRKTTEGEWSLYKSKTSIDNRETKSSSGAQRTLECKTQDGITYGGFQIKRTVSVDSYEVETEAKE